MTSVQREDQIEARSAPIGPLRAADSRPRWPTKTVLAIASTAGRGNILTYLFPGFKVVGILGGEKVG
jgi:hypothetical protein